MALVATAGASDANSYATLAEAEAYILTRLHTTNWDGAFDDEREAALIWATSLLDRLCSWYGDKKTDAQALRWPRYLIYDQDGDKVSSESIPQFLKDAVSEFALHLIESDFTITANRDTIGFKQIEVGSLNLVMDTAHGVVKKSMMPESVWVIVRPYCIRVGSSKRLVRV